MKTNYDQVMFREMQGVPSCEEGDMENISTINAIPPSSTDLNFIQAFNTIDREKKGHITKMDMLRFLNKLVINAKFTVEDICNIYRRLKIEAGDDSDTLSYIQFMIAILPPNTNSAVGSTACNTLRGDNRSGAITPHNQSICDGDFASPHTTAAAASTRRIIPQSASVAKSRVNFDDAATNRQSRVSVSRGEPQVNVNISPSKGYNRKASARAALGMSLNASTSRKRLQKVNV